MEFKLVLMYCICGKYPKRELYSFESYMYLFYRNFHLLYSHLGNVNLLYFSSRNIVQMTNVNNHFSIYYYYYFYSYYYYLFISSFFKERKISADGVDIAVLRPRDFDFNFY